MTGTDQVNGDGEVVDTVAQLWRVVKVPDGPTNVMPDDRITWRIVLHTTVRAAQSSANAVAAADRTAVSADGAAVAPNDVDAQNVVDGNQPAPASPAAPPQSPPALLASPSASEINQGRV
jgi:hypothetical protein